MRDADLAQRLLHAFGPNRFVVLGVLPRRSRQLLCDAGSEVHELAEGSSLPEASSWFKADPAPYLVCVGLSDEALLAVLSDPLVSHARGIYIEHAVSDRFGAVEPLEQSCFKLGYRKHPAYYRLFGYEELEQISSTLSTLLEPLPAAAASQFPMAKLSEERDLHMDMLREAGRRSDAHVVRYDWASKFIRPHDVVVDAACGLGYGTYVMRYHSMARRVLGIDSSEWAIDYATTSFAADNTEFLLGSLPEALRSLKDSSVDVVVSFETLEHVTNPTALLEEFKRILRPGGRIIVSVPNDWSDETGEDPNPHHLHVYKWERLAAELGSGFTIEQATRQIASGCKRLDAFCEWIERPRTLESVDFSQAPQVEAEWWLAVAMKSPEDGRTLPYQESLHGEFKGETHLVDFAAHYVNPWLVHGMVEIPFRLQNAEALKRLALEVRANYPVDSADYGASLAVISYRALEEGADNVELARLDLQIEDYLQVSSENPHVHRWQVSLAYVRARMRLRRGQRDLALQDFARVADTGVGAITPTLGTKVVDAAFWAGALVWLQLDKAGARNWWRRGLATAGDLLAGGWSEFIGNTDAPFVFAMNDAVEIVDRAAACAQALWLTYRRDQVDEATLYRINQETLRSALRRRDGDLITMRKDFAALRTNFDRVCKELETQGQQKADIERAAVDRLDGMLKLEAQLRDTEHALEELKKISVERLERIHALEEQLTKTDHALDDLKKTSVERLERIHNLEERLTKTDHALDEAKACAFQYLERVHALEGRLTETDQALNEIKQLSVQRLEHAMDLEKRLEQTDAALEEAKDLANVRLTQIHELQRELEAMSRTSAEAETSIQPAHAAISDSQR